MLIQKYLIEEKTVLDLCGGKGGDLIKWKISNIKELFFVDHAINLVELARKRYNSIVQRKLINFFPVTFIVADCFNLFFEKYLENDVWFNLISCQFASHYAFESERRTRSMLMNIASRLRYGGYFIGTIPDSDRLIKQWREEPSNKHYFGNGLYEIRFNPSLLEQKNKKFCLTRPFGLKYFFSLKDAINECPEFLLHFPTFVKIAQEYGLVLVLNYNFYDFFLNEFNKPYNKKMFKKMQVLNELKIISNKEWEIVSLYKVFSFQKRKKKKKIIKRISLSAKNINEEEVITIY